MYKDTLISTMLPYFRVIMFFENTNTSSRENLLKQGHLRAHCKMKSIYN